MSVLFFSRFASLSDEELMARIQGGEEKAFNELYRRYSGRLVRYFYRMLWREEARAQDMLHDLFVKIIEQPGRFDTDRKFSTWIYSAAFNLCKNEYRRRAMMEKNHQHLNGSAATDPADIDHGEFRKLLEKVLDADEEDKNLFALRYELELQMDEIAAILGCPVGTVKSKLFYLKKKLSRKLKMFDPVIN